MNRLPPLAPMSDEGLLTLAYVMIAKDCHIPDRLLAAHEARLTREARDRAWNRAVMALRNEEEGR